MPPADLMIYLRQWLARRPYKGKEASRRLEVPYATWRRAWVAGNFPYPRLLVLGCEALQREEDLQNPAKKVRQ